MQDGKILVGEVREAAARHKIVWGALVPNAHRIDLGAEAAEELAYQDMAEAKRRLRDHICETYGITAAELCSLAVL
ncbi:MAG TPA: hypothetical protein VGC28_00545 [Sphingomonas sp.]